MSSSGVWEYYRKNDDKKSVCCQFCESKLKYTGSTSSLWHHLRAKHLSAISGNTGNVNEVEKQPSVSNFFLTER